MNLREVQLSRSVIPVALALPINREPADIAAVQMQAECMRRRREAASDMSGESGRTVSFYL